MKRQHDDRAKDVKQTITESMKVELPSMITRIEQLDELLARTPAEPKLSTINPEEQAKILGDFNNPKFQWNLIERRGYWQLDPVLQYSLLGEKRTIARRISAKLDLSGHFLLTGVSGCGKTSGFTDLAQDYYVLYFQCNDPDGEVGRDSQTYDYGYAEMIRLFHEQREEENKKERESKRNRQSNIVTLEEEARFKYDSAHTLAQRVSKIELVCRLAQLRKLLQMKPSLTPFEYFIHQQSTGDVWVRKIRNKLKNLSQDSCRDLVKAICKDLKYRLLLCFDEIDEGFQINSSLFGADTNQRGFLAAQIQGISQLMEVGKFKMFFIGKGTRNVIFHSRVGKTKSILPLYSLPDNVLFPNVDVPAAQLFFSHLNVQDILDLKSIDGVHRITRKELKRRMRLVIAYPFEDTAASFGAEIINQFIIGSRFQTMMRLLPMLHQSASHFEEKPKILHFNYALCYAIIGMRKDLVAGLNRKLNNRRKGETEREYNDLLLSIWTSVELWGGEKMQFSRSNASEDLEKLGIGNFIGQYEDDDDEDDGYFVVNEPIVLLALEFYFTKQRRRSLVTSSKLDTVCDTLATLIEEHHLNASRGSVFEDLVFHSLMREEFQDKIVSELPFFAAAIEEIENPNKKNQEKLKASWWTKTKFGVKHVVHFDEDAAKEKGDFKSTASFLASHQNVLFAPETTARFNGMVLFGEYTAMSFALTIFTEDVPVDKIDSLIRSTDPKLVYFKINGISVNEHCKKERKEWEQFNLHTLNAIRVHIALPKGYIEAPMQLDDNTMLIHLNMRNLHLLLGYDHEGVYDLLGAATRTSVEDWQS